MKAGQTAKKSELTRSKIVDAALELFAEKGYDATTMRLIADKAGVSVGNAYHYFPSKEALTQGYFEEISRQFAARSEAMLEGKTSFNDRMVAVLNCWVEVAEPFREFAGTAFRYASQPTSPLSPFSPESAPAREMNIAVFQRVIDGSEKLKMASEVRERLPELLWMQLMGTVLYWVYDSSDDQQNTRLLIDRTVPLIGKLIGLSRLPVLRSSAADVIDLINTLAPKAAAVGSKQ